MSNKKFLEDRDIYGRSGELLLLALLHNRGIPAFLNPAPDPDDAPDEPTHQLWLDMRRAYDIGIGYDPEHVWDLWDAKFDYAAFQTKNLYVEANSLRHTRSSTFIYLIPRPSSLYITCLPVSKLIEMYNAQDKLPRGDGTYFYQYKYKHRQGGDQADNVGFLLPEAEADKVAQNFWEKTKEMKTVMKERV